MLMKSLHHLPEVFKNYQMQLPWIIPKQFEKFVLDQFIWGMNL